MNQTLKRHSLDHRYNILHLVLAQMTEDGVPVFGALKTATTNVDLHDHIVFFAGQIVAPFKLVDLIYVLTARLIVSRLVFGSEPEEKKRQLGETIKKLKRNALFTI